ncbi:CvpA family protein [Parendozoicomonas haliclonae]|uniref:Colicin V production protein n=1 Tax=Parendozoicomonas haliclonae TaxID=1960125 RepID=A0A1X7AK28_9GAMM|nr:CvpA family protein [Parendozoicomonas haliclonae]SMA47498.1 Colicin V production protein [Parendozoicomonas haliclonae]
MTLTWVDWAIAAIILISALISLARGFFREVLSLVTWLAAVVIAWLFSGSLAIAFEGYISTPSLRTIAAAAILFIATLLTGGLINAVIGKLVEVTGLTGTDRALGMIFGALRGVVLVTMLIGIAAYMPVQQDEWWRGSALIPHFEMVSDWLKRLAMDTLAPLFGGE